MGPARATFDVQELRQWAQSEGAAQIRSILRESAEKNEQLKRSQRVEPERLIKQITR